MQRDACEDLNQLVNDILDLARMERHSFNFDGEFFNFFSLIHKSFDILKLQAGQKDIQLVAPRQHFNESELF